MSSLLCLLCVVGVVGAVSVSVLAVLSAFVRQRPYLFQIAFLLVGWAVGFTLQFALFSLVV